MKIIKILIAVFVLIGSYLFVVNTGLERLNLPGTGLFAKVKNTISKDLTFNVELKLLPKKQVNSGVRSYTVFDKDSLEAAGIKIFEMYNQASLNEGGSKLTEIREEIRRLELAYKKIESAELLVEDGTPEQKLLEAEKAMIFSLHESLRTASNLLLQYGFTE